MRYLTAILLLGVFLTSYAQKGVYYELGITSVSINEVQNYYAFPGQNKEYSTDQSWSTGVGVVIPVFKRHTLQFGVHYTRMNYTTREENDFFWYTLKDRIQTIELPIQLKYYPFSWKLNPYLSTGIKYGYLLSSNADAKRSGGTTVNFSDDITNMR